MGTFHPGEVSAFDGRGFAGGDLAEMEAEADGLLRVGVGDLLIEGPDRSLEAEFLLQFPAKGQFPRFALLELAAGELPHAGKMGTGRTLGDQQSAIPEDQAGGDIDDGRRAHGQGVGLAAGTTLTELVRLAA